MVITFPTFISVVVTHQDCVLRLTYFGQGRAGQRYSYAQMLRHVDRIKQNRDGPVDEEEENPDGILR